MARESTPGLVRVRHCDLRAPGARRPGIGFVFAVPYILERSSVSVVWGAVAALTVLCFLPFAVWGRETSNLVLEESGASDIPAGVEPEVRVPSEK